MTKNADYRLPRNVRPMFYDIHLRLDMEKFLFSGEEKITLDVLEPTQTIKLHASGLGINYPDTRIVDGNKVRAMNLDEENETVLITFENVLEKGEYVLLLKFGGKISDKMHGLYRTTYTVNGEKRIGVATQCEATHARRIFPCFDEPDLKARFHLTVSAPKYLTVLSNMPTRNAIIKDLIADKADRAKWPDDIQQAEFYETPFMPTYLFALVAAELECIEEDDKNGIPIRVWTTPRKKEFGRFAMDCAKHTLPYFSEYFGTPYPLPKLDMVALPDFAHGAMENWGLITYRETRLLVDPQNSSAEVKQRVAEVVDHEIAHMWFGNLVTMKWWDDLWLNEGFASYAGPLAIAHQFPEWDFWTQFTANDMIAALKADSSKHTHPIKVSVKNPKDIGSIFDAISYSKGASLCRMLGESLGDNFRRGVAEYLKTHAYRNARTRDLWAALASSSSQPVKTIMDQFTRQGGYPVFIVKNAERIDGGYELTLEQKPFTLDGQIRRRDKRRWDIPVAFAAEGRKCAFWQKIGAKPEKIRIRCAANGWVKLNSGQTGFYRVAYTGELWKKLADAARFEKVPAIDRLGLVDDALALTRAGYMTTTELLGLIGHLNAEHNYSVWTAIARAYGAVENLVWDLDCAEKFHRFGQELFWPVAGTKGWDKGVHDNHLDILKRSLLRYRLGMCDHKDTIREAQRRFWDFAMGKKEIDPDIRQLVYSLTARYGERSELNVLTNIYDRVELSEEKVRVLQALGHFTDPKIIAAVLEFSASNKVRKQDHLIILSALGANPKARHLTWEFVKSRWEWIVENHGNDMTVLGRIIHGVASGFKTAQDLRDVRHFLREHKTPGLERTFKQTIEAIDTNICWLKRDQKDIENWIEKHEYGVPG